jgi:hypothetical protein
MRTSTLALTTAALALMALSATACSGSTTAASAPAAAVTATSTTSASSSATASAAPAPTSTASTDTGASSAGAGTHPCKLVTVADAEAAVHTTVMAPHEIKIGKFHQCNYTPTSGVATLNVETVAIDQAAFDKSAASGSGGAATRVTGLGADAYDSANSLEAWKDGTEITILFLNGATDPLPTAKKLMTAALARM